MRLSAICAMSENRVIGKDKKMPWHLPEDLKHFKKITLGSPIILGRKTYESIGKPLPGRENIVVTREVDFKAPGCIVVNSVEHALEAVSYSEEAFVIGGAVIYHHLLHKLQKIYLTLIHENFDGDTFFPELNMDEWQETERSDHKSDEKNKYNYSFITLERK